MPKNVQTTIQLHSFHMLARLCSKSFKLGFSSTWTKNFQMFNLGWEKADEHYFGSMWNECNCSVVWTFFGIAVLWIRMKTDPFQSCGHCWVFQIFCHTECSTFTASSFRIWNSSTGIPSPLLALFIVMLTTRWKKSLAISDLIPPTTLFLFLEV